MQTRKSGARPDVEQAAQAAPAPMAPQLSLYGGTCSACGTAWSCPACLATSDCTPSARCGSCRNVHSKAHRAAGNHASLESGKRRPRPAEESPLKRRERLVPSPSRNVDALDLPRSRAGLNAYYALVAQTTADLWSAGGGRWMHNPASACIAGTEQSSFRNNHLRALPLGRALCKQRPVTTQVCEILFALFTLAHYHIQYIRCTQRIQITITYTGEWSSHTFDGYCVRAHRTPCHAMAHGHTGFRVGWGLGFQRSDTFNVLRRFWKEGNF